MKQLLLADGWRLRPGDAAAADAPADAGDDEGWVPARVPGTAHLDLLAAGRIPDPFVGFNEHAVAWLGEQDVRYRCAFTLPPSWPTPGERLVLRCDGLDTFAEVSLNGAPLGQGDNMFVPLEAEIDPALLRPGENELVLVFSCAAQKARAREAAHGRMRVWNGDPSRVYVRKAQYHWGWDWGPTLLCTGPYRPVRLLSFRARLRGLRCPAEVSPDLRAATLPVSLEIDGEGAAAVALRLYDPAGALCAEAQVPVVGRDEARHSSSASSASSVFSIEDPSLWWPAGQGAQARYLLHAALLSAEGEVLDEGQLHLGLRRVALLQEPLVGEPGTSFCFEINNRPLFCGGANWIPADSFLPRVDEARYRALLQMARDAGMVMIRVWGGGIYEEDVFYDLCDELGLLIWQDFMFACGLYPDEPWFLRSVEAEAREAVRRLRHHPSLVLWCGNNEDYVLASSVGAYGPKADGGQGLRFAARPIYEQLLAAVCAAEDPSRTYWPGSPFTAPGAEAQDPLVGDRHTWDVWHGNMADYQDYGRFAGRFVSEFGMQAYPALATLASFTGSERLLPGPEVLAFHNKADGGTDRLRTYVERNVPDLGPEDGLDGQVYATQLMQAEALGWAYRSFRRRFGGPWRRAVSGALVWQLNDCWPCISWSVIDHALRRKASYYVIRRELLPRCVGLARGPEGAVQAWCVNGTAEEVDAIVALRGFTLEGEEVPGLRRDLPVRLGADRAVELGEVAPPPGPEVVVGARLLIAGEVVSRAALWPEPLRDLRLRDPALRVTREQEERALRLAVARPAKGVLLRVAGAADGADAWSDNLLDLLPGDEQVVRCAGAGPLSFEARHLQGLAGGAR